MRSSATFAEAGKFHNSYNFHVTLWLHFFLNLPWCNQREYQLKKINQMPSSTINFWIKEAFTFWDSYKCLHIIFMFFPLALDRAAQQVHSLSIQLHIKRKKSDNDDKKPNASPQLHTFCYFTKLVLCVVNFTLSLFYWEVFEDLLKWMLQTPQNLILLHHFFTIVESVSIKCWYLVNIIVNHMLSFHLLLCKNHYIIRHMVRMH